MRLSRALLPLLFAFALLSAQQGAALHVLRHAVEQTRQQDKQAPHSPACEQCATYAQLGSALTVGTYNLVLAATPGAGVLHRPCVFRSIHVIAAAARGPPALSQKIA